MQVTISDYERITGLIEMASLNCKVPEIAVQLLSKLKQAKMTSPDNISHKVVTMNSSILLKDMESGRETTITITYPKDSDIKNKKISVLTPAGIALLGCREGDVAHWKIPNGLGQFKIEKILYQPEASGDFHL